MLEFVDDSAAPPRSEKSRVAVSIKQPWATLILHGLKTIELRKWRPSRFGVVYVHTGANHEPSEDAWANLPPDLASFARLRRGLVGKIEITGVRRYGSLADYRGDRKRHLASDVWYADGLVGWTLANPEIVPFEPCPGNLRFFRV
jgi:hypothetical protein